MKSLNTEKEADMGRREALRGATVLGMTVAAALPGSLLVLPASAAVEAKEPEVTATEDLMREHGVIRRALLVYFEVVPKLRQNPLGVDPGAAPKIEQAAP